MKINLDNYNFKYTGDIEGDQAGTAVLGFNLLNNEVEGEIEFDQENVGVATYVLIGTLKENRLEGTCMTSSMPQGYVSGDIYIAGLIDEFRVMIGNWHSNVGYSGTFHLQEFNPPAERSVNIQNSLHISQSEYTAVELCKEDIIKLGTMIDSELGSNTTITVVTNGQTISQMSEFESMMHVQKEAQGIVIFGNKILDGRILKSIRLEFGEFQNSLIVQGEDKTWVIGTKVLYDDLIKEFELNTVLKLTNRLQLKIPEILLFLAIWVSPTLSSLKSRGIFLLFVYILIKIINTVFLKLYPNAKIWLSKDRKSELLSILKIIAGWVLSIITALIIALTTKVLGLS